jgi:NADPH:quinone reductase-like Zn-dependent oxidoreductase
MSQRQAIVVENLGEAIIAEVPMPIVSSHHALVKTTAVALNPIDYMCIDNYSSSGTIVGCDFAGIVTEVGDEVELDIKPGDRVAGFVHGCKTDTSDVFNQLFNNEDGK